MKLTLAITSTAVALIMLSACSVNKNTAASRSYHSTKVKYNIHFNGMNAFNEGEMAINTANKDDYSLILPLFAMSNHEAITAAESNMTTTIEKCRKSIKLHSIKKRPKVDPKKRTDPEYKIWLSQEEFNPSLADAWILLATAEMYKGDFLGSVSTFNYIIRHFSTNKDMVARAQLMQVRTYSEMGWNYEAEDLLNKVVSDDLSKEHSSLYAISKADFLLKQERYHEALPFVKLAVGGLSKTNRARGYYILGQLYEREGKRAEAAQSYKKVLLSNPSTDMDFNARLRATQLKQSSKKSIRQLQKMAKMQKNEERLDEIYGALGDIYLSEGDTANAIQQYEKGILTSKRGGKEKAAVLLKAADLLYQTKQYTKAAPYYTQVLDILDASSKDYKRAGQLSETLEGLVTEYNTVQLQDSLQRLSLLSPEQQLAVVEQIIADKKAQAQAEEEEKAQLARQDDDTPRSVNTRGMIGGAMGANTDWYFYNAQLLQKGKQEFQKQWGKRALEDNWRRSSKAMMVNLTEEDEDEPSESATADSIPTNTLTRDSLSNSTISQEDDPNFYLQQIPSTKQQIALSDSLWANALYKMVYIYKVDLEDEQMAYEAFSQFLTRFPYDNRLADLLYMQYLDAIKQNDLTSANDYKLQIITRFPQSKQAMMVSQPDYAEQLSRMQQAQDSLYEATYNDYQHNQFEAVKQKTTQAQEQYPLSTLMPRFLFLNAIAVAKTDGQKAFIQSLTDLVTRFPESEVGALAKNMLAMMNQGMESQQGGNISSLADRRSEATTDNQQTDLVAQKEQHFSTETALPSVLYIIIPQDEDMLNAILYQVALFNFSQFLIKDFDIALKPLYSLTESALVISGFDNLEEVNWYCDLLTKDDNLAAKLKELNARTIQITQDNQKLLFHPFTEEDYQLFYDKLPKQ